MNNVFGIHIGNTNSSIAVCKGNGQVEMIVDESGDRIIPTNVAFTEDEAVVGIAAKIGIGSKRKTTIANNKLLLNIRPSDLKDGVDCDHQNGVVLHVNDNEIRYSIIQAEKTKYVTPQNIVAIILKKLFNTAKNSLSLNEESMMCVLLVPHNFSEYACITYKNAAESAGWKVLQIINETAAAVLGYSLLQHKEPSQTILVYRLGGKTCEVAVYDLCEGMLYTLGFEFFESLGGNHFTKILTEYLMGEFFKKFKLDAKENRRSVEKLKLVSERCIHILSNAVTAHCFIESLQDGLDFSLNVSRARFELLIQSFLVECTRPIETILQKLKLDNPIDKVVLCGSATIVPKLRAAISNLFDLNVTQILHNHHADEILAIGAARQGYYLLDNDITEFLPRKDQIPIHDQINSEVELDVENSRLHPMEVLTKTYLLNTLGTKFSA